MAALKELFPPKSHHLLLLGQHEARLTQVEAEVRETREVMTDVKSTLHELQSTVGTIAGALRDRAPQEDWIREQQTREAEREASAKKRHKQWTTVFYFMLPVVVGLFVTALKSLIDELPKDVHDSALIVAVIVGIIYFILGLTIFYTGRNKA